MNKLRENIFLIIIIFIAGFLRFYQLSINPPHLSPDEAALGYNAYSILKTARDEYGEFLPIIFKSFGDYKPGLYIYASIIPVAIFGLTEFAVRFASAASGVVAVYLIYEIVTLFGTQKVKFPVSNTKSLAITSAFLLAISPWHIHFSRGAWEVNFALTLTLFGIMFFLKSLSRNYLLIVSAIFFGLSLTSYQGAKLSTGIVLLILTLLYAKELLKFERKAIISSIIIGVVLSIPIILSFFSGQTGRLKVFSVFSYDRSQEYLDQQLDLAKVEPSSFEYYLYYSESLETTRGIARRWFNHFSPRFLLFDGDWQNPRHSSPDHGEILIGTGIFLFIGLFVLAKRSSCKYSRFVLLWLILSPLPAVLSRDEVHAVRALNMVIPLTLTASVGFVASLDFVRTNCRSSIVRGLYYLMLVLVLTVSLLYFLDSYFVHQPRHNWSYWNYGYKQIVEMITPIQNNYEKINVQFTYAQPYIYFLFYQKFDPANYQQQANLEENEGGDVGRVTTLDNMSFEYVNWTERRDDFGELFVTDTESIPVKDSIDERLFKNIGEVSSPDGTLLFRFVEVLDEVNSNIDEQLMI